MDLSKFLPQIIDFLVNFLAKPKALQLDSATPYNSPIPSQGSETGRTLHLTRVERTANGIFSTLAENDKIICWVAEHAYDSEPKLPDGTWTVLLGTHQLDHGGPKQLYCVQNVPGHSGICFHIGNTPQVDSDGCLLLGSNVTDVNGVREVVVSEVTFNKFMADMNGVSSFTLVVS